MIGLIFVLHDRIWEVLRHEVPDLAADGVRQPPPPGAVFRLAANRGSRPTIVVGTDGLALCRQRDGEEVPPHRPGSALVDGGNGGSGHDLNMKRGELHLIEVTSIRCYFHATCLCLYSEVIIRTSPPSICLPLSSLVRSVERLKKGVVLVVGTVDGRRQGSNIHKDARLQIMVERKVCVKSTW